MKSYERKHLCMCLFHQNKFDRRLLNGPFFSDHSWNEISFNIARNENEYKQNFFYGWLNLTKMPVSSIVWKASCEKVYTCTSIESCLVKFCVVPFHLNMAKRKNSGKKKVLTIYFTFWISHYFCTYLTAGLVSFRYACRNLLLFESATAGCMIDIHLFENDFGQTETFAGRLNMLVDHFCIPLFLMHIFW